MKNIPLYLALLIFSMNSYSQIVEIPDVNFKNALLDNFFTIDINSDGEIQVTEAETTTTIVGSSNNIIDLTGIEAFTSLETLDLSSNDIATVNLSHNLALKDLRLGSNPILNIDLTTNTNLERLNLSSTLLETLNISNNTLLERLSIRSSQIEEIDLSVNTALELFTATNTLLTELDTTMLPELKSITLGGANSLIHELNLSNNPLLEVLFIRGTDLVTIDLQNNTNLIFADLGFNELETLDVSGNTTLEALIISGNPIETIDVSNLNTLKALSFNFTSLETIDLSNNPMLCFVSGNVCTDLISVNLQNGNNERFAEDSCSLLAFNINAGFSNSAGFSGSDNIEVICVDNIAFAEDNFEGVVDPAVYQEECSLSVPDFLTPTISIYPNPTQDVLNISENIINASLYDLNGKRVLETKETVLSLKELPTNLYILKIETSRGLITKKILKN